MNKKMIKYSLITNSIIVVFTIISSLSMIFGIRFMSGNEIVLDVSSIGMFKFFTVDSNIFMGIVSLIFVVKEVKILNGYKCEFKKVDYILKLMSTTAVGLTFFVVFAYLGPISEYGVSSLLMNSNLFFHLIIPVLSITSFILFEKVNPLEFKHTKFGLIPTGIYGLGYLINVLFHMQNGKVSPEYDWYWFVQNGVWTAIIVIPVILAITYIICVILFKLNKKLIK